MSTFKGKRIGKLQNNDWNVLIFVTKRINKERMKIWISKKRYFFRYTWSTYLWMHPRIYIPSTHSTDKKTIMVKYILRQVWGNWCRTGSDLSRRRKYFKPILTIIESVDTILSSNTPPITTPIFLAKPFTTPVGVQWIITDNYHWIRRKVRTLSRIFFKRTYLEKTYLKSGSYFL